MMGTAMQQHMLPIYQALQATHAQQPPILPPVHEAPMDGDFVMTFPDRQCVSEGTFLRMLSQESERTGFRTYRN